MQNIVFPSDVDSSFQKLVILKGLIAINEYFKYACKNLFCFWVMQQVTQMILRK